MLACTEDSLPAGRPPRRAIPNAGRSSWRRHPKVSTHQRNPRDRGLVALRRISKLPRHSEEASGRLCVEYRSNRGGPCSAPLISSHQVHFF